MTDNGTWNSSVSINSSVTIPKGYHNGSGKVSNSTTTMAGQTITPSSSTQTVSCSGKYMTGNITVSGVNRYGHYTGQHSASSYRSFTKHSNSGSGSASFPYVQVNLGFTPVHITATVEGQMYVTFTENWGPIRVTSGSGALTWIEWSSVVSGTTIYVPVYSTGSVLVRATGYY